MNNNTKYTLESAINLIEKNRQSGNTTSLVDVINRATHQSVDTKLIVTNQYEKQRILKNRDNQPDEKAIVTLQEISLDDAGKSKPTNYVFDNSTIYSLLTLALSEIHRLEEKHKTYVSRVISATTDV